MWGSLGICIPKEWVFKGFEDYVEVSDENSEDRRVSSFALGPSTVALPYSDSASGVTPLTHPFLLPLPSSD